jgi:flagellar motor switch protein FliM
MKNVLSPDEVDSLLDGINEGSVRTETDSTEGNEQIAVYDFSKQSGPVHLRFPGLGVINQRLLDLLKSRLASVTRSASDVSLASTESFKFSEFCNSLTRPASLNLFRIEPLKGFFLLVIEGSLVFTFVDSFFGGNGESHIKLEDRGFTSIENKIIEKVARIILESIENAWSNIYNIKTVYARSETDPQFTSIVPPGDMVIVVKFIVKIENSNKAITICMPYTNLEPIRDKLKNRVQDQELEVDQKWRQYIEKRIKETTVSLNCVLGTAKLNGKKLLELKVNDVIPLEQKVGDPIIVNVKGIPKFEGHPGSYKKNEAVRIIKNINKE